MRLEILIIDDKEQKIDDLRQVIVPLFAEGEVEVEEAWTIVDARDKNWKTRNPLILQAQSS